MCKAVANSSIATGAKPMYRCDYEMSLPSPWCHLEPHFCRSQDMSPESFGCQYPHPAWCGKSPCISLFCQPSEIAAGGDDCPNCLPFLCCPRGLLCCRVPHSKARSVSCPSYPESGEQSSPTPAPSSLSPCFHPRVSDFFLSQGG